jgi:hypothetical protein
MGQLYVKMATDLKLRRYSPRTQKSYLWAARRFVRHFMRAPGEMGSVEIREFLLMLHTSGARARPASRCMWRACTSCMPSR